MRVLRSSLLDVYQEDYIHAGAAARPVRAAHPGAPRPEERDPADLEPDGRAVRLPVRRHAADRGDLFLSRPRQLMVDAVRNADLPIIQAVGLTYCGGRAHHQHRGRRALRDPQSEAEGRVMRVAAPRCDCALPRSLRVAVGRHRRGRAFVRAVRAVARPA